MVETSITKKSFLTFVNNISRFVETPFVLKNDDTLYQSFKIEFSSGDIFITFYFPIKDTVEICISENLSDIKLMNVFGEIVGRTIIRNKNKFQDKQIRLIII